MFSAATLKKKFSSLPRVTLHGLWSRAIGFHLLKGPPPGSASGASPQPLWPGGPALKGARFTPKGSFGSLYLAENPVTALQEVVSIFVPSGGLPVTLKTSPWVVITVEGVLTNVLDLTEPPVQKELGTTLAELTGEWAYSQSKGLIPPTQALGKAAHDAGILGLKYRSAKSVDGGSSIVVFTDNFASSSPSYVEVCDEYHNLSQRLP